MSDYIRCPSCEHDSFAVAELKWVFENDIRIFSCGDIDYDHSYGTNISDDSIDQYYNCNNCHIDFILKNNELINRLTVD